MVGTHALVQGTVNFHSLGLAIIDEQHRFGVVQRATLRAKGLMPDVLVMTATPIPRTLALTVYGDLDVSVVRDMPPGRRAIVTTVRPESRRDDVYGLVRNQLDEGRQAYVVYPLIEESEKVDLKAATEMADTLAGDFSRVSRRTSTWADETGCKGPRHARVCIRGDPRAGVDDGHRSGHRRAQRECDGDRTRRALRTVAAASAARPGRPRRASIPLHPFVPVSDFKTRQSALAGAGGHHERVRDCRT